MTRRVSLLFTFEVEDDVTDEQVNDLAVDAWVQLEDPRTRDGGRFPGSVTHLAEYLSVDGVVLERPEDMPGVDVAAALDDLSDVEGWPQHLTCREAEALATVLTALGASQLAGELVAAHVEDDDEDATEAHADGTAR